MTQLANKHSAALDLCNGDLPLVQVYQCLKLRTWSHFIILYFLASHQLAKPDVKNIPPTKFNQNREP